MITFIGFLALFFLLSSSALTAITTGLHRLGRLRAEEELKKEKTPYLLRSILELFFKKTKWEGLLFSLSFAKHFMRIGFALSAFFFLMDQEPFNSGLFLKLEQGHSLNRLLVFWIALAILGSSLIFDFSLSLLGQWKPRKTIYYLSPFYAFILLMTAPLTLPAFKLLRLLLSSDLNKESPPFRMRDKVYELLQETELGAYLDANEHKLILSVVSFKERIAREVMVPRINLFSLSSDTRLKEAAAAFVAEGYSRIPVYKESVDNIIGVLHYKDILKVYVASTLDIPIEKLVKPALYTPETKKLSSLLQEFRSKQIHLAIVVDEWGGTEGVVTIEDILEELVGEIADEYDIGQQDLFSPIPGGWIVDAQMSIIDIQEELGVQIPQGAEYDTVGGYIFHMAGSIPSMGWKIHHDDFDLEILSSSERSLGKIKITLP